MPTSAKVAAVLMFVSIALTATPIIIFANRVEPTVFGMPFFLAWSIAGPFLAFVFAAIYTRIMNTSDADETHREASAELEDGRADR